jgi:hypothetical protein
MALTYELGEVYPTVSSAEEIQAWLKEYPRMPLKQYNFDCKWKVEGIAHNFDFMKDFASSLNLNPSFTTALLHQFMAGLVNPQVAIPVIIPNMVSQLPHGYENMSELDKGHYSKFLLKTVHVGDFTAYLSIPNDILNIKSCFIAVNAAERYYLVFCHYEGHIALPISHFTGLFTEVKTYDLQKMDDRTRKIYYDMPACNFGLSCSKNECQFRHCYIPEIDNRPPKHLPIGAIYHTRAITNLPQSAIIALKNLFEQVGASTTIPDEKKLVKTPYFAIASLDSQSLVNALAVVAMNQASRSKTESHAQEFKKTTASQIISIDAFVKVELFAKPVFSVFTKFNELVIKHLPKDQDSGNVRAPQAPSQNFNAVAVSTTPIATQAIDAPSMVSEDM